MKIFIKRWTRVIPCLLTVVLILLATVAPAFAATFTGDRTFNKNVSQPTWESVSINFVSNGVTYTSMTYESYNEAYEVPTITFRSENGSRPAIYWRDGVTYFTDPEFHYITFVGQQYFDSAFSLWFDINSSEGHVMLEPDDGAVIQYSYYEFNSVPSIPTAAYGENFTFESAYLKGKTSGSYAFSEIHFVLSPRSDGTLQGYMYLNDRQVIKWWESSGGSSVMPYVLDSDALTLRLEVGQTIDAGLYGWLLANGEFSEGNPDAFDSDFDFDISDFMPANILKNYMPRLSSVLHGIWDNSSLVVSLLTLSAGLCIISFLIFGSKR